MEGYTFKFIFYRYFLKPVSVIDANRDDLKNLELKLEQKLKER
jgi:hypothetical protein